jgi:hypothetical protein
MNNDELLDLIYFTNKKLYVSLCTELLKKDILSKLLKRNGFTKEIILRHNSKMNNKLDNNLDKDIYIKYARVSTKNQSENNSFLLQINDIDNFLKNKSCISFNVLEYNSAYSNIPKYLYLLLLTLKDIKLCVYNIDRFCRNIKLFQDIIAPLLRDNNINLIIISENNSTGIEYIFNSNNYEYDTLLLVQKILPCHLESCKKSHIIKNINRYLKVKKRTIKN